MSSFCVVFLSACQILPRSHFASSLASANAAQVATEPYKLGPFVGVRVSVSGFDPKEKMQIGKAVTDGGGKHTGELTQTCTHLVAKKASGDKYR